MTSLYVSWEAPTNDGRPDIEDYNYQYRESSSQDEEDWMVVSNFTALITTISGLAQNTEYEVQVQANNDEGTSGWSQSGFGSTGSTEANVAPKFTIPDSNPFTKGVPENTTEVLTVVKAVDDDIGDSVTGYDFVSSGDESLFSLSGSSTPSLTFSAPDFKAGSDNVYEVVVRATSGTGDRERDADLTVRVTVTNVQGPVNPPVNPPVTDSPETDDTPSGTGGTPSGTLIPLPEDVTVSFTRDAL